MIWETLGTITIMITKKARQRTMKKQTNIARLGQVCCRAFFVVMIVIVPMVSQIIIIIRQGQEQGRR